MGSERQLFWVVFHPCRPDFHTTMTPVEEEAMTAHLEALAAYQAENKLRFAGRSADQSHGVAIFEVDDVGELHALLAANPACRAGVLTAEVRAYRGPR